LGGGGAATVSSRRASSGGLFGGNTRRFIRRGGGAGLAGRSSSRTAASLAFARNRISRWMAPPSVGSAGRLGRSLGPMRWRRLVHLPDFRRNATFFPWSPPAKCCPNPRRRLGDRGCPHQRRCRLFSRANTSSGGTYFYSGVLQGSTTNLSGNIFNTPRASSSSTKTSDVVSAAIFSGSGTFIKSALVLSRSVGRPHIQAAHT